ncbi:hypothetical protein Lser_V15G26526 [Lactuca serriola]
MEDIFNNPENMHDLNNVNVKAIVHLKGSGCNIWEVFQVLEGVRRDLFRATIFGYLLDVDRLQEGGLLFHKMFLYQIRPDAVVSPDGVKRLYFRVGDTKMVYGPEEFCLITGFNFGEYPKMIGKKVSEKNLINKKRCLLRERLFPDHTNNSVKINDIKSFIFNRPFLQVGDADAVRLCLIYILCEGFLGKEVDDRVPQDWFILAEDLDVWNRFPWGSYLWDFTYEDLEDTWNKINNYFSLSEHRQTLKYSVSGFTAPIKIWIYERFPAVRAGGYASRKNREMPRMKRWSDNKNLKWVDVNKMFLMTKERQPVRKKMLPTDEEMTSSYYMSWQEYVYGERKSVPSPVRDNFRRQDESSSSMLSSGRSYGRSGRSGKPKLDEVLKRLHALEQHVFMNREQTKCTENVNYYDDYVIDGKQNTPVEPKTRNPSKHICTPYTELHTTPKQKRRPQKKVDTKLSSPVPPPKFTVVHDFSVLRLQPYVEGGEIVIQNYFFHSYEVQHRFLNLVLDRDFWSALFGHTHDGWLDASHITIWYRLLNERRFNSDRHTIMPPNFFVCHVLEEVYDWRAFMSGISRYPEHMVAWWDVDTVLMPIHSFPNHWLFGELRLSSMEVHLYDSLGREAYEKFKSDGTFTKFEARVAGYIDKINYWARRNIHRIPLNMQFILETNVPKQSSMLGDGGVFVCMFMEQLVSGQPIRELIDPRNAALEFRQRMAKIYWGSSLGPM